MPPKEKLAGLFPSDSAKLKPPDQKPSDTKMAAQSKPADTKVEPSKPGAGKGKPLDSRTPVTKTASQPSPAEVKAPEQKVQGVVGTEASTSQNTLVEGSAIQASSAETKDANSVPVTEIARPEVKGDGMASDLTLLRGQDNAFEIVKWTYMAPPLEKERERKGLRTEKFFASGKAPKERNLEHEKELAKLLIPKQGDPDYCVLKYGDLPSPRPEHCQEHGWISGPGSIDPPRKGELSAKVLKSLNMNQIQSRRLADCGTHGDLKIPMFVHAEVTETFDKWDVRRSELTLPCGYGHQPLRWLGQSACIRVAYLKDEAPNKFVPLAIKSADGTVLDPDKPIRDVLADGEHISIDYSSGPSTYRTPWTGRPPTPTVDQLIQEYFESVPKRPVVADVPPPKPPPPKKKRKKKGAEEIPRPVPDPSNPDAPPAEPLPPVFFEVEVQTPVDIITFLDWPSYDVPAMLLRVMPDLDETARSNEFMVVQEIMRAYSGAIQAMILWFSGQGEELEDKDFCLLDLKQFQNLFRVMKLCPTPFTENKLKECFDKYVQVNNIPGAFQISSWGFFPILLLLASDLYTEAASDALYHEKIYHFIVDDFLPNFQIEVRSRMEDLHSAETTESLVQSQVPARLIVHPSCEVDLINQLIEEEAINEREETAKAALRVAIPEYLEVQPVPIDKNPNVLTPGVPDLRTPELKAAAIEEAIKKAEEEDAKKKTSKDKEEPQPIVFANAWTQVDMEVDVKTIVPHFKEWLALGKRWDDFLAAALIIYALQTPLDIFEFNVKTATMRFGSQEIQRFLLAASHCVYKRTPLMRVSEHSFLRTYMQKVFIRAKIAKALYSTYDEKLEYLRQRCFRHEDPLPKLPEKKKGFM